LYTELVNLLEVSVHADGEAAEAVCELFNRLGRGGAVLEERPEPEPRNLVVRTYLTVDDHIDANRRAIEEGLWHLAQLYPIQPPEFRDLKDEDWANAWKSFHPVQHIGKRIVLKPTWREYTPQAHELMLELDPGMAFGTGQHPSTRFCLLAVERYVQPGIRVLDVGTGSGILAILAALMGAGEVFACDIDDIAVGIARENVERNGVGARVQLAVGTLGDAGMGVRLNDAARRPWDLILMNILAPVILELLPHARPLMRLGGHIVLSGLVDTQEGDIRTALNAVNFEVVGREQHGDWIMLAGQAA
jgi:ribosomal protein L11 methyltransferase